MIDWNAVIKVGIQTLAFGAAGWALAIMQDLSTTKTIASAILSAAAYLTGQRQEKTDFKV